jgi:hypothetical protein
VKNLHSRLFNFILTNLQLCTFLAYFQSVRLTSFILILSFLLGHTVPLLASDFNWRDCAAKTAQESFGMTNFGEMLDAAMKDPWATAANQMSERLAEDLVGRPPEASVSKGPKGEKVFSIQLTDFHPKLTEEEKKKIAKQVCAQYYPHMSSTDDSENLCMTAFFGRLSLWQKSVDENSATIQSWTEMIERGEKDWQKITQNFDSSKVDGPTETLFRHGWTSHIGLTQIRIDGGLLSGGKLVGYTIAVRDEGNGAEEVFAVMPSPGSPVEFDNPIFYAAGGVTARDYNCHMKKIYGLQDLVTSGGKKLC